MALGSPAGGGGALAGVWKVLITDSDYPDARIEADVLGPGVRLVRAGCRDAADLVVAGRDADGLLNQYCPIGAEALAALERCRVISRYGVGYDTVDVAAATARGICVVNVPDYCVDEVSDHALALLLASARGVALLDRHVRNGTWDYKLGRPMFRLRGRVLGLLGFGRIPRALAGKAGALGLRVLAHDPFLAAEDVRAGGAEPVALHELVGRADFVSVHVPLQAATRGLIGEALLGRMKPTAVLINTSRGPVVDEAALVRALREGRLAGAALDVLEKEPPPPGHPLLGLPGVILTPHVAWYSEESEAELRRRAAENVRVVLVGRIPRHVVNPEALPNR